jgi:hypothetical protein
MLISLVGEIGALDFISQITNPREITTKQILAGDSDCLQKLKTSGLPSEDILWSIAGAIGTIRHLKITLDSFSEKETIMLGNLLKFIGYSRADSRMSFFYMLLKECGVFTLIPDAVSKVSEGEEKQRLLEIFGDIVK